MSQNIYSTIVPSTTSGTQLATYLNDFKDAVVTGFSGTSRPTNLQAGGYWIDTTNATTWVFKIYDGTDDVTVFSVNISANTAGISNSDDTFTVTKVSADTVSPTIDLLKKRIASGGQVLSGDYVGTLQFKGVDTNTVAYVTARVRAVSTQNYTPSALGTDLIFEATATNTASLAEVMRLKDGKLGVGVSSPTATLHLKAGTASANTAPLKFSSGTNLTAAELGAVEFDGTNVFVTGNVSATPTRQTVVTSVSGVTNVDVDKPSGTLALGGSASTINIGNASATVNIQGSTVYQNVTNSQIKDALVTLNKSGASASASNTGLEFEEASTITGYIKTSADRNSIAIKAPNTAGIASLTPGASNDTVTLNAASQTLSNKTISGANNTITNVSLTTGVTGTLPTANGGTNLTSFTTNGAVYATSTSALTTGTLPVASGGTGATTQQAAINALTGTQGAGKYLRSDGTNASLTTIQAGDVPTLNQNTTGTAANVTGTVAIANGGSGATTQQAAINALTGTQVSGKYLRSDGTNASLSTIQAGDVPTLNQNTTGTAANVTGTVAIANGGTGQTTKAAGFDALSPMTTLGDVTYGGASGTGTRLAGNITTSKQFMSQTGTGTASAAPVWSAVSKSDVGLGSVENTALSTWAGSANITTVGTVGTGTWNATTIGVSKGGTGQTTYTDGQILIGNSTGNTLAKGTITQGSGITITNGAGSITVANAGVTSITGTASQVTASASTGGVTLSLPATINVNTSGTAANVSGTVAIANGGTGATTKMAAFDALSPATTIGDTIYFDGLDNVRLAGNTTTSKQFLSQTGTGTASAAPSWAALTSSDVGLGNVENTALSTWAGSSNLTTLGTVATGTWSATTIGTTKGGTGLTSFTANGAVYATSTSALTTGTLPVNAGGTGQTTYTNGQLLIGNTTGNTLAKATLTQGTGITITNGAGAITIANAGVTSITGTASQVTASASTGGVTLSLPSTINVNTSGTAANVTGTVAVANGGTGTTSGSITGTGALTFSAGGTNQNVTLTPSGTGYSVLNGSVGIGNSSPNSALQVSGPIATALTTQSGASYSITSSDSVVLLSGTTGTITATLPTAVGCSGRVYNIKRIANGATSYTVNTTLSQTIDGSTTYAFTSQYQSITVVSDGSNWHIL